MSENLSMKKNPDKVWSKEADVLGPVWVRRLLENRSSDVRVPWFLEAVQIPCCSLSAAITVPANDLTCQSPRFLLGNLRMPIVASTSQGYSRLNELLCV